MKLLAQGSVALVCLALCACGTRQATETTPAAAPSTTMSAAPQASSAPDAATADASADGADEGAAQASAPQPPAEPEEGRFPGCEGARCDPNGDEGRNAFTGQFRVTGTVAARVSALAPAQLRAYGRARVRVDTAVDAPWFQCNDMRWRHSAVALDEWLSSWNAPNLSAAQRRTLGVQTSGNVDVWQGHCLLEGAMHDARIELAKTSDGVLVTLWDGVAFALRR